jgi:hypothetical protein
MEKIEMYRIFSCQKDERKVYIENHFDKAIILNCNFFIID